MFSCYLHPSPSYFQKKMTSSYISYHHSIFIPFKMSKRLERHCDRNIFIRRFTSSKKNIWCSNLGHCINIHTMSILLYLNCKIGTNDYRTYTLINLINTTFECLFIYLTRFFCNLASFLLLSIIS